MKKIFLCTLATILFASCSTDITDIEKNIDNRESNIENTNNDNINGLNQKEPKLLTFSFLSKYKCKCPVS